MNLYIKIKHIVKKHTMWFILLSLFILIESFILMQMHIEKNECQITKKYSTIIRCSGIENEDSQNIEYLTYLQTKKVDIINNSEPAPYILLNHYFYLVKESNLFIEDKNKEYSFLLEQVNRCKIKEGDCTGLSIMLVKSMHNIK